MNTQFPGDNPEEELSAEDIAAIQEAIDDMEAGDQGMPLEDFLADLRARHKL